MLKESSSVRDRWLNRKIDSLHRMKWIGLRNKLIFEMNKAGVPLMCGSDAPAWFMLAGFAVHDELQNMVEQCGLDAFDALRTATVNPAKYLNVFSDKGTIEPGKIADLVLLAENPLDNIRNTRKIVSVINHGVIFDAFALQKLQ